MSPAHELALYLDAQAVGTFGGDGKWSVHVSREPIDPPNVITLYDSPGSAPDNYEIALRRVSLQVRIRAEDYAEGIAKQEEIFSILNAIQNFTVGDNFYLGVYMTSDFGSIGRDDNERHIITANYQAQRG